MCVHDIVCTIMNESGIGSDCIRLALKNRERKREYCVQYRETDLNFVTRLLEEEGIFYFFEHYEDKHVIVFGDNQSAYISPSRKSEIRFNIDGGMIATEESVSSFVYSRRLTPGKIALQDFNYNRIGLDLLAIAETPRAPEREIYDYPGNYFKQKRGEFISQIHKERVQSLGETAEGRGDCPCFAPGYKWKLANHDFADTYLTISVSHSGSQPQVLGEQSDRSGFDYHNDFLVIPSNVMIRPHIFAEKRLISGIQTATVVGPKGEEIHTDGHGRIMVQFHWDRRGKKDSKSSCWIRVAQSWGGLNRGAQYIPRIGDEVLVEFAEGDPDRPIVTGSVYNGDNLPIHDLDKSITQSGIRTKTHKGEGFNELRFDDANGTEEIFLHSQKDWNIMVKSNETKTVGNDLECQVGKKLNMVAGEQIQLICGNASILLDQSGKIVIHGSQVFVSGDTLHLDGKPIKLNMG
jgi:type VI secretion system secreted protein VgrG